MTDVLSVGQAKKRLSEIMSRAAYKGERFIIQRRGKAMAALVPAEDLERLEQTSTAPKGLLAAVGAWGDFEDLDQVIEEIYREREQAVDRAVTLEQ